MTESNRFHCHTIKGGVSYSENEYFEDSIITGPDRARYASIAAANAGVSFADFIGPGWSGTRSISSSDVSRLLSDTGRVGNSTAADRAYFISALDTNGDGEVSQAELYAYQFTSTAGNPTGQVNNYRIIEAAAAPYTVKSKGKTFYLQDTWTKDQWTVNAGVRAEEWTHYDSKGGESAKFDWRPVRARAGRAEHPRTVMGCSLPKIPDRCAGANERHVPEVRESIQFSPFLRLFDSLKIYYDTFPEAFMFSGFAVVRK